MGGFDGTGSSCRTYVSILNPWRRPCQTFSQITALELFEIFVEGWKLVTFGFLRFHMKVLCPFYYMYGTIHLDK